MEPAAGGCAGAGDIAAVLGDLRLHQYNVQQNNHLEQIAANTFPVSARPLLYAKCTVKSMIKIEFLQLFYSIHIKNKAGRRNLWKLHRVRFSSTQTGQKKPKQKKHCKKSGKNTGSRKGPGRAIKNRYRLQNGACFLEKIIPQRAAGLLRYRPTHRRTRKVPDHCSEQHSQRVQPSGRFPEREYQR